MNERENEEERVGCTYWVLSMAGYTFQMYFLGQNDLCS